MEIKLVESSDELLQILKLQYANHFDNVPHELIVKNGFVTVLHDINSLSRMNKSARQIIASENGKVIGYALVMLREFRDQIAILRPMFDAFDKTLYKGSKLSDLSYYVMGQVCIAHKYRGQGIFEALYQKHKEIYSSQFELCLTEVSTSNPRSLKAHQKVGFEVVSTFTDSTDEWSVIAWDWT